ncbi:MAG TPA: T9SS type A sorting domain-containing protein [Bacteroidia bacterium]|nr:T9SS type A sorting domain-containing protein [Bacteroidia bacterium]
MKKGFLLFYFFSITLCANAQVTFEKNYLTKGFFNSITVNQWPAILNASDSGYYLFTWNGDSSKENNHWLGISKVNKKGELLWNKNSDNYTVQDDYGCVGLGGVIQYSDSSFAMLWNDSYSNQVVQRDGLIHFDKNGNTIWGKKYMFSSPWGYPYMNCIAKTLDGGIIGWGSVIDDANSISWDVLMKTDSAGNLQWCKGYLPDNSFENVIVSSRVLTTSDSGFLVAFVTYDSTTIAQGGCLMKTDANGNPLWTKEYYPGGPFYTRPQIINNSIYLSEINISTTTMMVIKADKQGIPILANTYTNPNAIQPCDGLTLNNGSTLLSVINIDSTSSILKIDSLGNILWANNYDLKDTLQLSTLDIALDSGIVGLGADGSNNIYTTNSWQLLKLDKQGRNGCEHPVTFTKTPTTIIWKNSFCYVQNITLTIKDTILNFHYAMLDTSTLCFGTVGINEIKNNKELVSVYPNPTTGIFTIALVGAKNFVSSNIEIYNVLGERVLTEIRQLADDNRIDLSGQPNGVYFYRVVAANGNLIGEGKVVVER